MHYCQECLKQFMAQSFTVHIYSSPKFATEILIGGLIFLVHLLLIMQIDGVSKKNNHVVRLRRRKSLKDVNSRTSAIHEVIRNHPDLGVEVVFGENAFLKKDWDTVTKINKILSTSISEYIRKDLNDKLPEEQEGEPDLTEFLKMDKTCTERIGDSLRAITDR